MKTVNNDTAGRGYCGPHVVAGMTGRPLSHVLEAFRIVRFGEHWRGDHYRPPLIKGTSAYEVRMVLQLFGYEMVENCNYYSSKPTMARWYKTRCQWMRDLPCAVNITGHWVLVKGNMFLDTFTNGQKVRIGKAPHRRARVKGVYGFRKSWHMDDSLKRGLGRLRRGSKCSGAPVLADEPHWLY